MAAAGQTAEPHASRRRLGIGRRLFYTHLLVALLVAFGLGTVLHFAAEAELRASLNQRLADNAALAADALGSSNWDTVRTRADTHRPEYIELVRRMQDIIGRSPAIERLLVVREDADRLEVVADSLGAVRGHSPGDSTPAALRSIAAGASVAQPLNDVVDGFNALSPLPGQSSGYLLLLRIPVDDIDDKLEKLRAKSTVSFVLAVALALAMSMWLAQSARRVLRAFAMRFRQIAEGKLDQRLDLGGNDEFADLALALEDMTSRLAASQRDREGALVDLKAARDRLEGMVRERSVELEKLNNMLRQEIEQRCQLEAALAEAAATDSMTRLLNRRGMLEALEHAAEQARRQKGSFIVAVADIDHFKRINDQFGHSVGDQVLVAVGRRLKQSLQDHDAAGRWGGEEFLLLWPGMGITEAEARANQLREAIASSAIYAGGPQITISLGLAEFTGLDSLDRCINRADRALYRAKMEGRNRVCVAV